MSDAIDRWMQSGRRIEIAGHPVFVVEAGLASAETIAVLHGFPSSSADWERVLPWLAQRYRVVLHDHLGFGLSSKPEDYGYSLMEQADVALGVWRALGVDRLHLVAHDYGTSVATELLARRVRGLLPVDLSSLTLSNGSVHLELAKPRPIQWLLRRRHLGPAIAAIAPPAVLRRTLDAICATPLDDDEVDRMWQLLVREDGRARLPRIGQYLDERVRFRARWIGALQQADLPVHLLWGRQDPIALPAVAEQIARETPGAMLTWLDALGHYPMLEDPTGYASALTGFVDGLAAAR